MQMANAKNNKPAVSGIKQTAANAPTGGNGSNKLNRYHVYIAVTNSQPNNATPAMLMQAVATAMGAAGFSSSANVAKANTLTNRVNTICAGGTVREITPTVLQGYSNAVQPGGIHHAKANQHAKAGWACPKVTALK